MGASKTIPVTCPGCGQDNLFELCEAVNPARNPEMKARLNDGSLFRMVCPRCGFDMEIGHQFLYRDAGKGFMVFLAEGPDELASINDSEAFRGVAANDPAMKRLRGVYSPDELREKVAIFDAGLDDRLIELLKLRCLDRHARFAGSEGDALVFALADGTPAPLDSALYRDLAAACETALPGETYRYEVYDAAWAETFARQ